jgi:hypothetical protein
VVELAEVLRTLLLAARAGAAPTIQVALPQAMAVVEEMVEAAIESKKAHRGAPFFTLQQTIFSAARYAR